MIFRGDQIEGKPKERGSKSCQRWESGVNGEAEEGGTVTTASLHLYLRDV